MLAGHHWSNHGYAEPAEPIKNPLRNAEDLTVALIVGQKASHTPNLILHR
jgi:hypothetical protein